MLQKEVINMLPPTLARARKSVTIGIMLTVLLMSMLILPFNIQTVKAETGTIYIRADGSVDPSTAPILNVGNVYYTFMANIYDSIVVQRSNIVLNGAGYNVQGTGSGTGILLRNVVNVIVKNVIIKNFDRGMMIRYSSNILIAENVVQSVRYEGIYVVFSLNCEISGNMITSTGTGIYLAKGIYTKCSNHNVAGNSLSNNFDGIRSQADNTTITKNTIMNGGFGIALSEGDLHNTVAENEILQIHLGGIQLCTTSNNNITGNIVSGAPGWYGIWLQSSSKNNIAQNNVSGFSLGGIRLEKLSAPPPIITEPSMDNKIYHNNFVQNTLNAQPIDSINIWDDGYPSGGNYWSDYTGVDEKSGHNQDQLGSDGIGDTPYIIDVNNRDRYPLMKPWTPTPPPPENKPPTCVIELQKDGVERSDIDVGEFFDIYVGDSTDDTGIKQVRFSSDDSQDGNPTGVWTEWYDWDVSSGDWNVETKIKRWSFATCGAKEVWAEVKDDIGQTDRNYANILAKEWSFAIITDLHIGRGYPDYGGEGWYDMGEGGKNYYLTDRLTKTVNWIIQCSENYNIKFVMVLGDIADSAEYSEFDKAKEILTKLDNPDGDPNTNDAIPYVPVIGNHDVWPYTEDKEAEQPESDWYFQKIFIAERLDLLKNYFDNWESPIITEEITWGFPQKTWFAFLQNYVFDYNNIHFIVLDCVARKPGPGKGVGSDAVLWPNTINWIRDNLHEGKSTIIFSHHPFTNETIINEIPIPSWMLSFESDEINTLHNIIRNSGVNVLANFAGHIHGFESFLDVYACYFPILFTDANLNYAEMGLFTPASISVLTTEALMVGSNKPEPKGVIRIVKVKDGKIDFSTIEGEFRALNPYFKTKIPLAALTSIGEFLSYLEDLKQGRIDFEAYAFTKRFTEDHPLSYILNYDDSSPEETTKSSNGEPVWFTHYYDPKSDRTYDVTLTVNGYTPEDEPISEEITKMINPRTLITEIFSPVEIAVTDPDGLTISKEINEIPGAAYLEYDITQDGDPDDIIVILNRKTGDYHITVTSEPDAEPTDRYTLNVWGSGTTTVFADNVQISDIPDQPYLIESTETTINCAPIADAEIEVEDQPKPMIEEPDDIYFIEGNTLMGANIILDATASYDPEDNQLTYSWSGDVTGTVAILDAYLPIGEHEVILTVSDGRLTSKDVLFVTVQDTIPPETWINIGEPKFLVDDITYLTSATPITLGAEDNPGGSGLASTAYRIYNSEYDSGWITYTQTFYLIGLSDGTYHIDYKSTDFAENVEPTNTATIVLDNSPPSITIETPSEDDALQDGITFTASVYDLSEVASLTFSIREPDGEQGKVISPEFESLPATLSADGKWKLIFDTTQLPDQYYLAVAEGTDVFGHTSFQTVSFSIRNWAAMELLPASEKNKAGRTMPIKFSLRIVASVDPNQPFVRNEELTIIIFEKGYPEDILQTSTYGATASDYRIDDLNELYITNFKTLKMPRTYVVEIYRKGMLIGTFEFSTVK